MEVYNLGSSRHLCWDDMLIEKNDGADIVMHKLEKKEISLNANKPWEGPHNGYAGVIKTQDAYRLYYRAFSSIFGNDCDINEIIPPAFCVAFSKDGKKYLHPKLGLHDVCGCDNNIIHYEDKYVDNFSVFYDENPDCPPDEKYKALKMGIVDKKPVLYLHTSPDGIKFSDAVILDVDGEFDTYNVMLWDKETKQYFLYYRGYHKPKFSSCEDKKSDVERIDESDQIRDIRVATSKDFKTFTLHGEITFLNEETEDIQYYTNQIFKYPRADDMFIALPTRYIDRKEDIHNFEQMPLWERRKKIIDKDGRSGTAITDTILMTSRDGFNFKRCDEAFFTPSEECDANWWYGDCYFAYGMAETESDTEGAPNELSLYVGEGYRVQNVSFRRYTMRLDGFYSWYAKHRGGAILTKPFAFKGEELEINFSTSAYGHLIITVCDIDGNELDGYKTGKLFGDSVDRKIKFGQSLSNIKDSAIRLKIELKDAHLYSFKFN